MRIGSSLAALIVLAAAFAACTPTHLGLGYGLRRNENFSAQARWEVSKDRGLVHGFTVRVWGADEKDQDGAAVTYGLRLGQRWHYRLGGGLTTRDIRLREKVICADQGGGYQWGANEISIAHVSCIGDDQGLNWLVYEREVRKVDLDKRHRRRSATSSGAKPSVEPSAVAALPSLLTADPPPAPWEASFADRPGTDRADSTRGRSSSLQSLAELLDSQQHP